MRLSTLRRADVLRGAAMVCSSRGRDSAAADVTCMVKRPERIGGR